MVTAGTFRKARLFGSRLRLRVLTEQLLDTAEEFGWSLEAWAVFSNHYHVIGKSPPEGGESLRDLTRALHRRTATWVNRFDGEQGRKVWHNYRDTELTFEKSYFARLNYVIQNPVKHGLVKIASDYPWCSAAWFEREATPAFRMTIESFPIDAVKVEDDFEV